MQECLEGIDPVCLKCWASSGRVEETNQEIHSNDYSDRHLSVYNMPDIVQCILGTLSHLSLTVVVRTGHTLPH